MKSGTVGSCPSSVRAVKNTIIIALIIDYSFAKVRFSRMGDLRGLGHEYRHGDHQGLSFQPSKSTDVYNLIMRRKSRGARPANGAVSEI